MLSVLILFVATIVFAEASVLLFRKQMLIAQLYFAVGVAALHLLFSFLLSSPWQAQAHIESDIRLLALNLWSASAPIILVSLLAFMLSKVDMAVLRHVILIFFCIAIVFAYPWFLLLSICASGLDCV
jgi:hypothetical protein